MKATTQYVQNPAIKAITIGRKYQQTVKGNKQALLFQKEQTEKFIYKSPQKRT